MEHRRDLTKYARQRNFFCDAPHSGTAVVKQISPIAVPDVILPTLTTFRSYSYARTYGTPHLAGIVDKVLSADCAVEFLEEDPVDTFLKAH